MSITIKTDAKSLLETFAALKKIPMQKVIRNAARDFTQAAIATSPLGRLEQSPYGVIRGKDKKPIVGKNGKTLYVNVDKELSRSYYYRKKQRNRKTGEVTYVTKEKIIGSKKRRIKRLPMRQGWSKASWIGVFRALGVPPKGAPSKKPPGSSLMGTAVFAGSKNEASVTITDNIHFTALGGMEQTIVQAGHQLAASRIVKEFNRQIQRIIK